MGAAAETNMDPPAETLEYQLKAGFLINFAKFVQWPANTNQATNEFRIGVLADAPVADVLASALNGKPLGVRMVKVLRVTHTNDAAQCQMVFVARTATASLRDLWSATRAQLTTLPVLTVGEEPGFAARGGCINLIPHKQSIRFEVNPKAAERAGLQVSAKLASLAKLVETEAAP